MHRVVLTGLGAVSPCGLTAPESWDAVCQGRSGVGRITGWDTTGWAVQIGGQVDGFEPSDHFDRKQARRMERFVQFALVAA
jgi:3-oxoacyl-[acyl-carrier-protein] synthase II